jgi:hydrogenase maturation protease
VKTLILGLGNPILTDDGVGLRVARELANLIPEAHVVTTSLAGLNLLDLLPDYDRICLIDACLTGEVQSGSWRRLEDGWGALHLFTSHGMDFRELIVLGRNMGLNISDAVYVYGIEIKTPVCFGEELSPELESKVPDLVREIAADIRLMQARGRTWLKETETASAELWQRG